MRRFLRVPTVYVLSNSKKTIIFCSSKHFYFYSSLKSLHIALCIGLFAKGNVIESADIPLTDQAATTKCADQAPRL